jgi:hypothetical protein
MHFLFAVTLQYSLQYLMAIKASRSTSGGNAADARSTPAARTKQGKELP